MIPKHICHHERYFKFSSFLSFLNIRKFGSAATKGSCPIAAALPFGFLLVPFFGLFFLFIIANEEEMEPSSYISTE